jgi:hypothetical protein
MNGSHNSDTATPEPAAVRMIALALALAAPTWILGLHIVWFHVLAFAAGISLLSMPPARKVPGNVLAGAFLLFALACGVSILISVPRAETSRIAAAVYTSSYWLMGAAVCYAAAQQDWQRARARLISTAIAAAITALIIVGICLVAWYGLGIETIIFRTPLSLALGSVDSLPFFSENTNLPLMVQDGYVGGGRPRITVLAPYPTATAILFAFLLPILWVYRAELGRWARPFWIIAILAMLGALWFANSRAVFVGSAISYLAAYLVYRRRFVQALILALPLLILLVPTLSGLADSLLAARADSTSTRMTLYAYQFDRVMNEAPLFGFGVKDRTGSVYVPVGSQSTAFGALYRYGLVGVLVFAGAMVAVTLHWFRAMRRVAAPDIRLFLAVLGGPLLLLDFVIFTEDLDWPQMLCFVYFFIMGSMVAAVRADARLRAPVPAAASSASATAPVPARAVS